MPLQVKCPSCGQGYSVGQDRAGSKVRCAKCQTSFTLALSGGSTRNADSEPVQASSYPFKTTADSETLPRQFGRFELRRHVGAGSFGTVYLAYDQILKREVAIKQPHLAAQALDERVAPQFLREAQTSAQLRHPNIVPVYDAGEIDGRLYLVSAFIHGATLQTALKERRFDVRAAVELVVKLADALAYAHGQGVIHRDVKPANIILDSSNEPFITDFGLARWEQGERSSLHDGTLGTPLYMSPEQAGMPNVPVTAASDQYSLGVVLFELLCGRVPFQGDSIAALLGQIRQATPPELRSLAPEVPRRLEEACAKAMAKQSAERYADCRALADNLRQCLSLPFEVAPKPSKRSSTKQRPSTQYAPKRAPPKQPSRPWSAIGIRQKAVIGSIAGLCLFTTIAVLIVINRPEAKPVAGIDDRPPAPPPQPNFETVHLKAEIPQAIELGLPQIPRPVATSVAGNAPTSISLLPTTAGAPAQSTAGGTLTTATGSTSTKTLSTTAVPLTVGAVNATTTSGGAIAPANRNEMQQVGLADATGYGAVLDRMAQEFRNLTSNGKLLVVWVLDQSESMADDRMEIEGRIERVYQQLGLPVDGSNDAMLTGVVGYGAAVTNQTPKPLGKPDEIMAAIRSMTTDTSGMELQCEAIQSALAWFGPSAAAQSRQTVVVLVTDESGDASESLSKLEVTITLAKQQKCKIYVLGREAIFGYTIAYLRYIEPGSKVAYKLRIDRGPETPYPELLQIDGFGRRQDAFPSGFGPYDQTRMARQTGGIFFMLPSPEVNLIGRRSDLLYDAEAMRPYVPDLSSRTDYAADRDAKPLRAAVWKVINDLSPYKLGSRVEVRTQDFPVDDAKFAAEARIQIKRAQDVIDYLHLAQDTLDSVADLKPREASARWRANYELAYAQTIAYRARLREYQWYLAEFVKTPKPIKNPLGPSRPTNEWNVYTIKRLLKPEATQTERDAADALLAKIVADHPGTPYAARAEWELRRGYGIELNEGYDAPSQGIKFPKY